MQPLNRIRRPQGFPLRLGEGEEREQFVAAFSEARHHAPATLAPGALERGVGGTRRISICRIDDAMEIVADPFGWNSPERLGSPPPIAVVVAVTVAVRIVVAAIVRSWRYDHGRADDDRGWNMPGVRRFRWDNNTAAQCPHSYKHHQQEAAHASASLVFGQALLHLCTWCHLAAQGVGTTLPHSIVQRGPHRGLGFIILINDLVVAEILDH